MKTTNKNKIDKLNVNIGKSEIAAIGKIIASGKYLNTSDYVRDVIRADLRKRELI